MPKGKSKSKGKDVAKSRSKSKGNSRSGSKSKDTTTPCVNIYTKNHFKEYPDEEVSEITREITLKKPLNAYQLFIREKHAEAKKKNEKVELTEISEEWAPKWNAMDKDDKAPYEADAKKEKEKYDADFLIVKSILVQDYDKDGATAYRLFANEKIRESVMKGEKKTEKQIMKEAREAWDKMNAEQKRPWNIKKKENDEFWKTADQKGLTPFGLYCKRRLLEAEEKREAIDNETIAEDWKNLSDEEKNAVKDDMLKIKAERKRACELRDAVIGIKPTRPAGAFGIYCSEHKGESKGIEELKNNFNGLSSDEKDGYEEKARKLQLEYKYKQKLYNDGRKTREPSKARNAYSFFAQSLKGKILPKGYQNFGTYTGELWRDLSSEEKEKFEKMAEKDKERHDKAVKNAENRIYNKPKKARSAYNFFVEEKAKGMKLAEGEELGEKAKDWAPEYNKLTKKERAVYEKKAKKDEEEAAEKLKMFNEKGYYIDKKLAEELREKKEEKAEKSRQKMSARLQSTKKSASKAKKAASKPKKGKK